MLLFSFTKMPNKSKVGEEGLVSAHGLRTRSIVEAKAWWREREVAGRVTSAVRQYRVKNSVFSLLFPFYATLNGPQPIAGATHPHLTGAKVFM